MDIKHKSSLRMPNGHEQIRMSPWHIKARATETQRNKIKSFKRKTSATYRDTTIRVTSGLSSVTSSQEIMEWYLSSSVLTQLLYSVALSLKTDKEIQMFEDTHKLRQFMTTNLALQKTVKGILHTEEDAKTLSIKRVREYDFHRGTDDKAELRRNPPCPMQ